MNRSNRTTAVSSLALASALASAVVLAACGGAAEGGSPAKAPMRVSEPEAEPREPSSVAEAQDQIARARTELDASDQKKAEADADKDVMSSSSTTGKPSAAPPREEARKAAPADPCAHSCRAISSMRRAVTALCRMTGDEDARCAEARRTLEQSESRVAQCHCGS